MIKQYRFKVLSPHKMQALSFAVLDEAKANQMPDSEWQKVADKFIVFNQQWQNCFERFGSETAGELSYRDLLLDMETQIGLLVKPWLKGGAGQQALNTMLSEIQQTSSVPFNPKQLLKERQKIARRKITNFTPPIFDRPIFIISAPRSGSTLLFESLAKFFQLWTIDEESHELIEGIAALHPATHNYKSNRLTAEDASTSVVALLQDRFARQLQDAMQQSYIELPYKQRPTKVRFLEKTPKNALRIPFLRAAFPDARFIVLYRKPEETISSMLEGWRSRRFVAYQPLPNWAHKAWKFLLTPEWEKLNHRPLVEIVAHQWRVTYETIFADLQTLPKASWHFLNYADLIAEPQQTLQQIAQFAELTWDEKCAEMFANKLPLSSMTLTAPNHQKWCRHAEEINMILNDETMTNLFEILSKMIPLH